MKKKVYAYIHTHWDREWYREFEEFRIRLIEVVDDVLEKLLNNEFNCFYFDGQTAAIEDYIEIHPEKLDLIKKLVSEKRIFLGPYYCSTDSFLVDRESLIRNLQNGLSFSKKLGCKDFIAYHADTFGHSKDLPYIVKYFDIKYGIFWRGCGKNPSEFNFYGLDSTYLIEGYFHDELSLDLPNEKKAELLKKTLDKISSFSSEYILLPLGADHLGVADLIKSQIQDINKYLDDYEIILSTPFEYYEMVKNNFNNFVDYELRSCERNFILPGVLSSRIDLKEKNVRVQWLLSSRVEPLQAVFSYLGKTKNYQKEIDYAYKMLLKNHAHDSIYGCSLDSVHKENIIRYEKVCETLHAIEKSVIRDLKGEFLTVLNFSENEFSGAIKLKSDEKLNCKYAQLVNVKKGFPDSRVYPIDKIPVTEDYCDIYEYLIDIKNIKPYSIKKISEHDFCVESSLKITDKSISNKKVELYINDGKIYIKDKIKNKTYVDFIKIIDRADVGDSYNFGALFEDKPLEFKIIKTEILEQGKIRSSLKIISELYIPKSSNGRGRSKKCLKHNFNIIAILENQNDFIEFKIEWKNKSLNHIVQVEFNFENNIEKTISDDLISVVERTFDSEYNIYNHLPASRGVELKYNTAPIQKFLKVYNSIIITEGLQEYEIIKNRLRITLLRSTGVISNPKNPTRGTPAGPPLPVNDLQMLGENSVRFALMFENDFNQIQKNVDKFFDKTFALFSDMNDLQFIKNSGMKISAIKTDENNDLIIRLFNDTQSDSIIEFSSELNYSNILILNAMEEEISVFENKKIKPNEFITLKLKR